MMNWCIVCLLEEKLVELKGSPRSRRANLNSVFVFNGSSAREAKEPLSIKRCAGVPARRCAFACTRVHACVRAWVRSCACVRAWVCAWVRACVCVLSSSPSSWLQVCCQARVCIPHSVCLVPHSLLPAGGQRRGLRRSCAARLRARQTVAAATAVVIAAMMIEEMVIEEIRGTGVVAEAVVEAEAEARL